MLPWWLSGKESACNVGDLDSIPGLGGYPAEGNGNPLQYSCLENPRGQRSMVGYSPRGRKQLDVTETKYAAHTPTVLIIIMCSSNYSV